MLTEKEELILESIKVPSENDPNNPEFPPDNPHWPSTPIKKINVPGFSNVFLKDESVNPTGTHKDRMAWEMVATYRQLLLGKKQGAVDKLPQMSIISSGSAAIAIQHMFSKYNLPTLKVLIDYRINKKIKQSLEKIGCEIYETDLSKRILSTEDILKLTNNVGGIDITSDDSLGPFDVFYDWISYDIINQDADYVFVPYGMGHLFENIVNVAKKQASRLRRPDPRFKGNVSKLKKCNFIGATTNNPNSKADKLYSPHLPFVNFDMRWIQLATRKGYIGKDSHVYAIQESFLDQAMEIAQQNKIKCEPSGIAGLALLLQMRENVSREAKILIVNTGKSNGVD